jgi:Na+/proline symporter
MVVVLVLCAVLAPEIKKFKGVYAYLVQIWSLLAPPVFVCVVAGIFTRRATPRGAVATLTVGTVLGAITFWALGQPDIVAQLPRYLRSALNCGFVITLVCAATMALVSRSGGANPGANEVADLTAAAAANSMTSRERRIFRFTLAALAIVWLAVIVTFSPWGVARAG